MKTSTKFIIFILIIGVLLFGIHFARQWVFWTANPVTTSETNVVSANDALTWFEMAVATKMQQQWDMIVTQFKLTKEKEELLARVKSVDQNLDMVNSKIKTLQSETNDLYKSYLYTGSTLNWSGFM